MKKNILLAVDSFDQSLDLVRYCSKVFLPKKHEITLLHVESPVPDTFMDMAQNDLLLAEEIPVNEWITKKQATIDKFLEKAKSVLVQAGFDPESVMIRRKIQNKGVARDIADESKKGYDLLILGRSETHFVNDVSIGSVANKLVIHCNHIPIAVIGGTPETDKMLIGFDGSRGAVNSVNFLCSVLQNTDIDITLCYIIRPLKLNRLQKEDQEGHHNIFQTAHEQKWQLINKETIRPELDRAMKLLKDSGWPTHLLHEKIVMDVEARSQQLVKEARQTGCGTIVAGRHGKSFIKEFFLGRVGQKIINQAYDCAVWLIN